MPLTLSEPLPAQRRGDGRSIDVASFDLLARGWKHSPVVMLDDFQVRGHPFGPHPHAGFSAVTYVFPDSPGGMRSRDSLGNDHLVAPGGIVWTQAANGVLHEEMLADPGAELRGLQFFVNLTGANKAMPPAVFVLDGEAMPLVEEANGSCVRIAVGSYRGTTSPLCPAEPFSLFDIALTGELAIDQADGWVGMIHARTAPITIEVDGNQRLVPAGTVVMATGGGTVRLAAAHAQALYLGGPKVVEAVVQHGPFIMRDEAEVLAAVERYHRGDMGRLPRNTA